MPQDAVNAVTVYQATTLAEFSPQIEVWQLWKEKLDIHFCEINCTDDNVKKAILQKSIGAAPYAVVHSLCSPESPVSKTYKHLCDILETHYTPPSIIFRERKLFHCARKEDNETISEWYARTKKLALNCKFGEHLNAFLLDRFVMGLPDKIFEKLCEEDEKLQLEVALRKALIMEMKLLNKPEGDTHVNYVGRKQKYNNSPSASTSTASRNNHHNNTKHFNKERACKHCGWPNHKSHECRYKESRCNNCSKLGHLANVSKSKTRTKRVNHVSDETNYNSDRNSSNNFCIYSISCGDSSDYYYISVIFDGQQMKIACDSGSPCSLIPTSVFEKLNKNVSLRKCTLPYVDYGGNGIKVRGEYFASIEYRGTKRKLMVIVTDTNNIPLSLIHI